MSEMDLSRFISLTPGFFPEAKKLRSQFETRFADPRRTPGERFVWDYWHIPGQYTVLRTPARSFFDPKTFNKFQNQLLDFGGSNLGCNGISEPWLSYYIEGCSQSLHSDNPHGPWAYVYSLTPWKTKKFTGGETLIARPELLQYWEGFSDRQGYEFGDFFVEVPAIMNQLLVFDPRLPHGVKEVNGVKDPRDARLVIHGWFTEPRPFVEGALHSHRSLAKILDRQLKDLTHELRDAGNFHGSLSFRLDIKPSGKVGKVTFLRNTLIDLGRSGADHRLPLKLIRAFYSDQEFSRASGASQITIPLLYRS